MYLCKAATCLKQPGQDIPQVTSLIRQVPASWYLLRLLSKAGYTTSDVSMEGKQQLRIGQGHHHSSIASVINHNLPPGQLMEVYSRVCGILHQLPTTDILWYRELGKVVVIIINCQYFFHNMIQYFESSAWDQSAGDLTKGGGVFS